MAGKSTLNRLELTAPDYDGNALQIGSDKPETNKITVDPESIDALFNALSTLAPVVYGQQEGRYYHGYHDHYCYLPLYVLRRLSAVLTPADVQDRRFGRFGGGVGTAGGAHSPALAGG